MCLLCWLFGHKWKSKIGAIDHMTAETVELEKHFCKRCGEIAWF